MEEEERATQEQVQTTLVHLLLRIKEELPWHLTLLFSGVARTHSGPACRAASKGGHSEQGEQDLQCLPGRLFPTVRNSIQRWTQASFIFSQVVFDARKAFIEHCQVMIQEKRWHSHPQNEIWDAKLHLKYTRVCHVSLQKKKNLSQVVHGMKFKTKSGISIPPPAIVKQDGMST